MFGMLKATCNLWVGVQLEKLPVMRRTLLYRRCNSLRLVSAANSQTEQV